MKKLIFSVLLSSILVLSVSSAVFADDSVTVVNWEDVEDTVSKTPELDGTFVTLKEINVKFYIPYSFDEMEITDELYEQGMIAYYVLGDFDFEAAVYYYDYDLDYYSFDEYTDYLRREHSVEHVDKMLINGYGAISYRYPDNDKLSFTTFLTDEGGVIEFVFAHAHEEGSVPYSSVIVASIMNSED